MTSKDFFKEVKLEWCVSEQQDKPLLNDMMKFAKLYHKEQLTLTDVVKSFYCWDEQALGKERRCQEECETCASVRKEK